MKLMTHIINVKLYACFHNFLKQKISTYHIKYGVPNILSVYVDVCKCCQTKCTNKIQIQFIK